MKDSGVGFFWDMTTMLEAGFYDKTNVDTLTNIEVKIPSWMQDTVIVEAPTIVLQKSTPKVRSSLPISKEEDPLFHEMAETAPLQHTGTMRLDVEKPVWRGWGPLLISLMLTTASILALVQA